LGVSVLPVLDAPADIRDCLVKNDKQVWNGVDCGGATISTVSSLASFGVISTGPAIASDVAEDVTDIISITRRFLLHASSSAKEGVAQLFKRLPEALLEKVVDKAKGGSDTVVQVVRRAQLRKAGFNSEQVDVIKNSNSEYGEALRLSKQGVSPSKTTELTRTVQKVSSDNVAGKVSEPLTLADVRRATVNENTETGVSIWLISTTKWSGSSYTEVLSNGPGWRHITARHAHRDAPGNWPISPDLSTVSGVSKAEDVFPASMTAKETEEAIMLAARKGEEVDGDSAKLVLKQSDTDTGSVLRKYDIEELVVIRDPSDGHIITAYPR
jgi:hypothetical protein